MRLPDGSCAVAVGDIGGHGLPAAAAMEQTRSMLRALLYQRPGSPGAVLAQLDRTLQAITDTPLTTACLALLRRGHTGWRLCWSTAGHPAPLLLVPGKPGRYLDAKPGLPLGIDPSAARPDQHHRLPGGATVVFFTDGLVEHHKHPIDEGLATWPSSPHSTPANPPNASAKPSPSITPATALTTPPSWPCGSPPDRPAMPPGLSLSSPGHPPTRADQGKR